MGKSIELLTVRIFFEKYRVLARPKQKGALHCHFVLLSALSFYWLASHFFLLMSYSQQYVKAAAMVMHQISRIDPQHTNFHAALK